MRKDFSLNYSLFIMLKRASEQKPLWLASVQGYLSLIVSYSWATARLQIKLYGDYNEKDQDRPDKGGKIY